MDTIERLKRERWRAEQEMKLAPPNSWYARVRRRKIELIDDDIAKLVEQTAVQ
jgi:hypothetical protein